MSRSQLHLDADTSIKALHLALVLKETQAADWTGQVRWLNQWQT